MKSNAVGEFKVLFLPSFQPNLSSIASGVTGSFVAVLALSVLYECVRGLHVHLRSILSQQDREKPLTEKKSDFEYIR